MSFLAGAVIAQSSKQDDKQVQDQAGKERRVAAKTCRGCFGYLYAI